MFGDIATTIIIADTFGTSIPSLPTAKNFILSSSFGLLLLLVDGRGSFRDMLDIMGNFDRTLSVRWYVVDRIGGRV